MRVLVLDTFSLQLYLLEEKSRLQCVFRDKITTTGSSNFLKIASRKEEQHKNHHVRTIFFGIVVACKQPT